MADCVQKSKVAGIFRENIKQEAASKKTASANSSGASHDA
jgi:hypothetical protein